MTDNHPTCPDCAAQVGQPHHEDCDVARCLQTGMQRLMCGGDGAAEFLAMYGHESHTDAHDCGRDVWSGEWPGKDECRRHNLCCLVPMPGPIRPCLPRTPGASEDLNRLTIICDWNPATRAWEQAPDTDERHREYLSEPRYGLRAEEVEALVKATADTRES